MVDIHEVYARLGSRADTGYGQTDVNGRADTTEEEFRLQEDLTIGDTIEKVRRGSLACLCYFDLPNDICGTAKLVRKF